MNATDIKRIFNLSADLTDAEVETIMSKDFRKQLNVKHVDVSVTPENRFLDDIDEPKNVTGSNFYKYVVNFIAEDNMWSPDQNQRFNQAIIDYIASIRLESINNRENLSDVRDQLSIEDAKDANRFLDNYYKYLELQIFEDLYKLDSIDFKRLPDSIKDHNNFKVFYVAPLVYNQFQEDDNRNSYKEFCEYKYEDYMTNLQRSDQLNNYIDVKKTTEHSKKIENKIARNREVLNKIANGEISQRKDLDEYGY